MYEKPLTLDNHNNNGNPHSQYDTYASKEFKYMTPEIAGSNDYGYVKIGELMMALESDNLPSNLNSNIIRRFSITFNIRDIRTAGDIYNSRVEIYGRFDGNYPKNPDIKIVHTISSQTNDSKAIDRTHIFCKVTPYPQYAKPDSTTQPPAKIEFFAGTTVYGMLSVYPERFSIDEYHWTNQRLFGRVPNKKSTNAQRFDDFMLDWIDKDPLTVDKALELNGSQYLVWDITQLSGDTTLINLNDGDALDSFFNEYGETHIYVVDKKNVKNSPFDNNTSYFVRHERFVKNWEIQTATSSSGIIKRRTKVNNIWSSWG